MTTIDAYVHSYDRDIHKEPTLTNVRLLADYFLEHHDLAKLEYMKNIEPKFVSTARFLARSKQLLQNIEKPTHTSFVFATYNEIERMKKPADSPVGENPIQTKVEQLNWLFGDKHSWDMFIVDDGCPYRGGEFAQQIIDKSGFKNISVLYLADAIKQKIPVVKNLESVRDSQKGGAIRYGLWHAAQQKKDNHYICYTDTDLSADLGQAGFIVDILYNTDKLAAIGSRREYDSVVVKNGIRNLRGKLFIYLWKRMLHELTDVVDSQCAFKGFKSEIIPHLTEDMTASNFAFDLELLLKTNNYQQNSIQRFPITWIDSDAASTPGDPYLSMLKTVTQFYERYSIRSKEGDKFSSFIKNFSQDEWNILVNNIPKEIAFGDPQTFTEYNNIKPHHLKKISNQ